jgi:hypothetical protein
MNTTDRVDRAVNAIGQVMAHNEPVLEMVGSLLTLILTTDQCHGAPDQGGAR